MTIEFTVFKGSEDGTIKQSKTSKPDLKDNDVLVHVTASGLCGTDEHYRNTDMVLGHEGVGRVKAVGPTVQDLKVGDRVGWGYEHSSCGRCQQCLRGSETYCPSRAMYGEADFDQGSFASAAVWKEDFLFKIPDSLSDEAAAPLMCGGATVFNALRVHDTQPTDRVGIIGMGGLGHLAIQFAAKMGCDVVVFSGTDSKREEALQLGAKEFYATKGVKELKIRQPLDQLLVTTSAQPDWNQYLPVLAPGACIVPLSISAGDLSIPYMPILLNGLRIQGSIVAPRYTHRQMIAFAALHGIHPIIEKFPMTADGITKAMHELDEGHVRYRAVLLPQGA
ncbi:GroES-like protein [Viridothelium virens]|uniref:GroES-like protein n=1 Tax=Viridothelium virens TaxID=1048519 RepID=A0A6A6H3A1_VIRVR|nr:GroES-like protein [Viridothelium virens]